MWTQSSDGLAVSGYSVSVQRLIGNVVQSNCPSFVDDKTPVALGSSDTSTTIDELQEFSNYRLTIVTTFTVTGGSPVMVSVSEDFTTLSAGELWFVSRITSHTIPMYSGTSVHTGTSKFCPE